jgi:hypothetical protein
MQLALKHAPPKCFLKRAFHELTAYRLVTHYPHSGIVIGDQLQHTNLSRGVHAETFIPVGWDLFDVPGGDDELTWDRFQSVIGLPYDVFSQLAFIIPNSASDSSRLYCFELTWFLLTGQMPRRRVTPEDLLAFIAKGKNHDS